MKYKPSDKVRIKSIDWYNEHKDMNGNIFFGTVHAFNHITAHCCCGKVYTIDKVNCLGWYEVEEEAVFIKDEMIEGLVEEETLIERVDDKGLPFNEWLSHKGAFHVPNGYELKDQDGNVINATKIVLEKKKKEYPKTYEECYQITGLLKTSDIYGYKNGLLFEFQKLLIARDAYWKIAGEEMGLGKPWKPDWTKDEWSYMAYISYNGKSIDKQNGFPCCNTILTFPTAEMRDAFYENFKELIEQCKELL